MSYFKTIKQIAGLFNETSATLKKQSLSDCANLSPIKKTEIIAYHDALLFLLAYPESPELFSLAQNEMHRLCAHIKTLPENKKETLALSGIAYTPIHGSYSFSLLKWLTKVFPENVRIHSFDETGLHPKEILKQAFPEMEFEWMGNESLKPIPWLKKISGRTKSSDMLIWLLEHFDNMAVSSQVKELLFESLKLYVSVYAEHPSFSKSFGNISKQKIYCHPQGLKKRFEEKKLINTPLPPPQKLSEEQKRNIISSSRITLALLNRETDPVTYCNETGLLYYELEHGLSIALFSMLPERRLPLESYIGFMMFKNGYPMAYGGAWLFAQRSLLGINIFEWFRGGESAFVFAQLVRTYKQAFGAEYFEVEPYQFGKNNPEGLKSGAFWFYYRFGFRPIDKRLKTLAKTEHEKILTNKGYKTPIEVLKEFTKSNVAETFSQSASVFNPSQISLFVTQKINSEFSGNRKQAETWCNKLIKKELGLHSKPELNKLNCFVAFCIDFKKLKKKNKLVLKQMLIQKIKSEYDYINLCRSFDFSACLKDEVIRLSKVD